MPDRLKMGDDVLIRAVFAAALALGLAACANETTSGEFATTSALAVAPLAPIAAIAPASVSAAEPTAGLPKKTMSDRVLTAIALERVTGLKPDPSRLAP